MIIFGEDKKNFSQTQSKNCTYWKKWSEDFMRDCDKLLRDQKGQMSDDLIDER